MQLKMAHPSCPLCKRQVPASSAGHTLDTRLCEQCQVMVLKAFRGVDSIVAASTATVHQNGALAQVQPDAAALNRSSNGTPAVFEDIAAVSATIEEEAQPPIPFEANDASMFDFSYVENSDDRIYLAEADLSRIPGNESSVHRAASPEGFEQSSITEHKSDHNYAEVDDSHPVGQPSALTESVIGSASAGAGLVADHSEEAPLIVAGAATDPWDDPLPAWDYSHSEWPVLVGSNMRRPASRKRRAAIAAVVLSAAAAVYFFIYLPTTSQRRTATDSGTTSQVSAAQPGTASAESQDSNASKQAASSPSDTPSVAASEPAETIARESVASTGDNNAQGRFSLQAAAFPNQDGADEFAEKLKRAGVPSYVVPAEVARRGRWFRVRVGRFNAADEAQRFAGEAQQRARAVGLAVQLIVCQYDQP